MQTTKLRGIVAAITTAGLFGFAPSAMADATDDIVNALMAKGVLTEEEGQLLLKGRQGEKEAAEEKKKSEIKGKFKDGIVFESGDGQHSMQVTGRLHFDYRNTDIDDYSEVDETVGTAFGTDTDTRSTADQFEVRRARLGVKGKLYEHFEYEVMANLVGSNTNTIDVAYLNVGMFKPVQLKLGQFKQPFNLEEYGTSSNNIDFMERSYVNQLTPGKKPGAMVHGVPTAGVTYAASYYQQNPFGETDSDTDGKGVMGRATVNFAEFMGMKESVLHLGLAGFDSEYGLVPATSGNTSGAASTDTRGSLFSMRSGGRGLNNIYRAQIAGDDVTAGYGVSSPTSAKVENKAFGLEAIAAYGPFKLQGEYMKSDFDAKHENTGNEVKADVKAWYAEALWLITGENYADAYKNGAWGSIKPKSIFDVATGKGWGAWELGLRYDAFDVSDVEIVRGTATTRSSRIQGAADCLAAANQNTSTYTGAAGTDPGCADGGAKTYTAGIKWILNPNLRFMLNYSHTKFDNEFRPIDVQGVAANNNNIKEIDSEDLIMLRGQVAF